MRSCVATYGRSVAVGRCSLYHVCYRGRHYTLELRMDSDGKLYRNQVTGVGNAPATARLENMLDRYVGQAQPKSRR